MVLKCMLESGLQLEIKIQSVMKIKMLLPIIMICLSGIQLHAQDRSVKVDTVRIQTSAKCDMCKERLEHDIAFEKGVKYVLLDNDTKILTVAFKHGKTDKEKIKIAVTRVGYDADEMPANQKAHDRLPACCQKDNKPH